MTGEITLRGLVLPVGGIKEKVIAAYRSGFRKVLLPLGNKKDAKTLPKHVQDGLEIIFVKNVEQVIENSFEDIFFDHGFADDIDVLSKL